MPTLKLIFTASSQTSMCLGRSAVLQKMAAGDSEPVFQGLSAKKMQTLMPPPFVKNLKKYLKAESEADKEKQLTNARNWLEKFACEDEGKSKVWIIQNLKSQALPVLARLIREHPVLSRYELQPLYLTDEPLENLHWNMALNWKTPEMSNRINAVCSPYWPSNHVNYAKALVAAFPDRKPALLPADGELSTIPEIEAFLGLSLPSLQFTWPTSFAGLDFWAAARGFPFGVLNKDYYDLWNLFAIIQKVETEEGFEKFFHLWPQDKTRVEQFYPVDAIDSWSLAPQAFLRKRRKKMLQAGELSETLPLITGAQCEKFVQALPDTLRIALLRHFRSKTEELSAEELALAKGLEEYRARNFPSSPFRWPRPEPVVSVLTMTRNHHKYIMECMEGVRAQKTDFPIEHIIVDDASDDGSQDIIDNYASTYPHVRPIYLPSRSTGGHNIRTLFEACASEFAALCDGDDYFCEPSKLQKQVNFLSRNQDCALCFHPVMAVYENNAAPSFIYPQAHILPRGIREKYYLPDIIKSNFIQTNSVVYRWRFRNGLPAWFRSDLCPSDWYWHILHAENGKIGFIPEVMSIYRRHPASYYATSFTDSSVNHRRLHGMGELKVYSVINKHFNNRYFRPLSVLADGVLSDFLRIMMENDDSSLLNEAVEKYPEFVQKFLQDLKNVNKKEN